MKEEKEVATDVAKKPAVSETAGSKKKSNTQTKSINEDLGLQHVPNIFFPIT